MATTYEAIATVEVGAGGASSIDFTSIPATYTDLKIIASLRSNFSNIYEFINFKFNGSTSGYSTIYLRGNGASASSAAPSIPSYLEIEMTNGDTATANTFGSTEIYIPNYTSSNYKSLSVDSVSENNATTAYSDLLAGLWSNTSTVTSISIAPQLGTSWKQYSTATLYGIKNS